MPVSASVLAWRAAICAAMAIWGVTWVPEARRAATLSTGLVAMGATAVTALHSNGVGTVKRVQPSSEGFQLKSGPVIANLLIIDLYG